MPTLLVHSFSHPLEPLRAPRSTETFWVDGESIRTVVLCVKPLVRNLNGVIIHSNCLSVCQFDLSLSGQVSIYSVGAFLLSENPYFSHSTHPPCAKYCLGRSHLPDTEPVMSSYPRKVTLKRPGGPSVEVVIQEDTETLALERAFTAALQVGFKALSDC